MKRLKKNSLLAMLTVMTMLAALIIQMPLKAEAKSVSDYKKAWTNVNTAAVQNGPTKSTTFKVSSGKKLKLQAITLYHYNYARGVTPGKITLKKGSKKIGTWKAKGRYYNQWWDVFPNKTLSAGTYTITCSSKKTWSCNSTSKYAGFAEVYGTFTGGTSLKKPVINSIKYDSKADGYVYFKITWGKVSKADGYEAQVCTNKNFKSPIKGTITNNYVYHRYGTGNKKNVTYYVRVRAYKKSGSKNIYSKWSSVKSYVIKW
ncbi:hypothetical protein SAMN05216249_11426 [Acetitomaculum ruminis DSM 5522]|uniref:Fibronectin type-III domain-containing protein n=1 Tax=Acetitomaculum ruminis DSM 5522 TaxID=1120918 RepID=A0A1I0ZBX7_9FIRM|nr:hypothetical protein [Acetitomaculum ruminis]SFB22902.1 hypothetical protein SAMN05216249_11426 [Acetitomaculum ruminis DSM 5522]